jgi:hypothetical protein
VYNEDILSYTMVFWIGIKPNEGWGLTTKPGGGIQCNLVPMLLRITLRRSVQLIVVKNYKSGMNDGDIDHRLLNIHMLSITHTSIFI